MLRPPPMNGYTRALTHTNTYCYLQKCAFSTGEDFHFTSGNSKVAVAVITYHAIVDYVYCIALKSEMPRKK